MGLLDLFKKKSARDNVQYVKMLDGSMPIFSQCGKNLYASDVVQQALYTIVTEMMKLTPKHIKMAGMDIQPEDGNIQQVLENPNELMTTSEFIEKYIWNLLLNYNSFIYVSRDASEKVTGLYPLSPQNVTFMEGPSGRLYCEMRFASGYKATLPYSSLIHLKMHFSVNDLMGGNEAGQPDNDGILNTVQLNDILLQGVKKALNTSFSINGVVKYNTMIGAEKMETKIKEFEEKLKSSQSGFLGTDNKAEFIQMKRDIQMVDEATLKFIDDKILRNFGTPVEIVRGNYTADIYESFYQKTIEPLVITSSQGFTKGVFTKGELSHHNKIKFFPKELIFMNTAQTLAMVNLLGQSGTLFENEKRAAFGYAPLAELNGVRMQSLNYVNTEYAREHQVESGVQNKTVGSTGNISSDTDETIIDETVNEAQEIVKKPLLVGQIQALSEIVAGYQAKTYTYNQAKNMLMIGVGLSSDEAEKLLDTQQEINDDYEAEGQHE